MEPVKTINYKKHIINVFHDENPDSPRNDDNICEFHCAHRRYSLGDDGFNYKSGEDCVEAARQAQKQGDIVLPLYLYDHSGITISLSPFSCPWDSGQVGYVIIPRKKVLSEYSAKIFTKSLKEQALKIAQNEVANYDKYLKGEIYGYQIDEDGDSCWGYYGIDFCINDAKSTVDYIVNQSIKKHCQRVKQWIMNKVPLVYRTGFAM